LFSWSAFRQKTDFSRKILDKTEKCDILLKMNDTTLD